MLEAFLNIKTRQVIPTDTRGILFTGRVSQVNVNTMKITLEQLSELQVAECLTVHVLSSSHIVSRLELRKKGKQRSIGVFVSPTILYSMKSVYMMRECIRTMS